MACIIAEEIDETFEKIWDWAIILTLIPFMVLFGLISNGLCFVVINKCPYKGPSSTPILLNFMLGCESLALLLALFEHPTNTIIINLEKSAALSNTTQETYAKIIRFSIPTSYILHRITVFLVLLMTFEQYILVYKPTKLKNSFYYKRISKLLLIILLIASILFSIPEYITAIIISGIFSVDSKNNTLQDSNIFDTIQELFTDPSITISLESANLLLVIMLPYCGYAYLYTLKPQLAISTKNLSICAVFVPLIN